ncbi:MAG: flagellar basal body P-ring formation chaperone FlgA [Phycisphaerales bacterium]
MRLNVVILVVVALAAGVARSQTAVVVRPAASVDPGRAVLLREIATLTGDDAARLGDVQVLVEGAARGREITVASVRSALDAAGVNWGRVTLSGAACRLATVEEAAPKPAPAARKPAVVFEAADGIAPGTVKHAIALRLAELYGVEASSLRMAVRSSAQEDVALLNMPLAGGPGAGERRVEAIPGTSAASGRVAVRVDVYEGTSVLASRTISVDVLVKRSSTLPTSALERDQPMDPGALTTEDRWLSPAADPPLRAEEIVGQNARRRIEPGRPITRDDVRPPVVVNRGDVVWVHVLSGSVSVKAKARALEAGRDGEDVLMQIDGSKKTFNARMSGRGTAVMNCSGGADRETP